MTQGLFRCLSFNIFENLKRPPQQQGTPVSNEVHLIRIFSIILLPGFFSTFPHCMRLGLQVAPTSLSSRSLCVNHLRFLVLHHLTGFFSHLLHLLHPFNQPTRLICFSTNLLKTNQLCFRNIHSAAASSNLTQLYPFLYFVLVWVT